MSQRKDVAVSNGVTAGPPEGFRRSGSAPAVGWFNNNKIGNVLSGKLIGMYVRKDALRTEGTSKFFQVQVDRECEVRAERGEEAKIITAKAGDVVNVNYGPKTKPWESYIPVILNGAEYAVFGTIVGQKVKIGGGRSMHNFDCYDRQVKPPTAVEEPDEPFAMPADGPQAS